VRDNGDRVEVIAQFVLEVLADLWNAIRGRRRRRRAADGSSDEITPPNDSDR
jgi:hypothetical protein